MAACAHLASISSCTRSSSVASSGPSLHPQQRSPDALHFEGLRVSALHSNKIHQQHLNHAWETRTARCITNAVATVAPAPTATPVPTVPLCDGLSVILIAFECAPWSKTGGLADVIGGLAPALAARCNRVMTVSVRHDQYKDAWDTSVTAKFPVGDKEEEVRYFHTYKRGVDRVFVDHPYFLAKVWGKTNGKLYGPVAGKDYEDNQLRFSLFAQAAIEAARVLNLNNGTTGYGPYGEDVIFVANDWHTALVPCYLKAYYKSRGLFKNAKVAFCIHNMAYQGRFPPEDFDRLNLPESFRSSFAFLDGYDYPVKGWKINWMKAAITESDILITVSPNYAKELTAGEDTGVELNKEVEKKGVIGITNGMDVQEWDPSTDKFLEVNYDVTTAKAAKEILRQNLRSLVGLEDKQCPILGFVGRLEEQKGSDILAAAVPEILKHDVQMVILGTGKKTLEAELKDLEARFPGKVSAVCKFDSALAHLIIAAVHFMVIPSRFEPCGLNQLYAMRYGTPPIAPPVGGLVDTIKHGVTGFLTSQPFNIDCEAVDPSDVKSLSATIEDALQICETPSYVEMMETCMAQDLSWKEPAKKWEEILLSLNVEGSKPGTDGDEIAPLAKENVATP